MELLLIFFLLHVAHSGANHSLTYVASLSTGLQNFPEFMGVILVDGVQQMHCDSSVNRTQKLEDWFQDGAGEKLDLEVVTNQTCIVKYNMLKSLLQEIQSRSNQTGGVHILQQISGCELDEKMNVTRSFYKFIYNREDFMWYDVDSQTWNYSTNASIFTNPNEQLDEKIDLDDILLSAMFPELLKYYLTENISLHRKDPPSVSLLRQSPSSPVSCHATGFYTTRVQMFWRKDGEEIHENVDQGEILPNQDGTFQMRVDLNISADEDWSRYECVFQLPETNSTVLRLDPAAVRTNSKSETNKNVGAVVIAMLVVLCVFAAVGFIVYRKKAPDLGPQSYERLTTDV